MIFTGSSKCICLGIDRDSQSPCPSSPPSPWPQVNSLQSEVRIAECSLPQLIMLVFLGACVIGAGTGTIRGKPSPSPSFPNWLHPQLIKRPDSSWAIVCMCPQATCLISRFFNGSTVLG